MPAPRPESVERVAEFLIVHFHEAALDEDAVTDALVTLRDKSRERWELSQAFDDLLGADLPANTLRDFVRRHANRQAMSDEDAREFLEDIRRRAALDFVPEPDDA